jgi:hypothetical protein
MADKDWGQGAVNNDVNWGKARFVSSTILPNAYGWGGIYEKTWTGDTNIIGVGKELQQDNSDYYVYILEQEGGNYLRFRIEGEFWLDDVTKILLFWNNAGNINPPTGSKSFYGTADSGWFSILGSNDGYDWWGCGFYVSTPALSYTLSSDHKLHIGLRVQQRTQRTEKFTIGVGGINDSFAEFTVASTQSGLAADYNFEWGSSEWISIEVPYSFLNSRGMGNIGMMQNQNYLYFKGDAGSAVFLEVDAVFWYRNS